MAAFLLVSFIAGILTILAPCVFALLPAIVGGVAESRRKAKPFVIIASLALSIILFTVLLRATTLLISIPNGFWQLLSGFILAAVGLTFAFPTLWYRIASGLGFSRFYRLLATGEKRQSFFGDILIGAALGPVFSSCSPAYAVIVAVVFPQDFTVGILYLLFYVIGLSIPLLLISFLGQRIVGKLAWATDPRGWFKRLLGVFFILAGIAIGFGLDKKLQTLVLNHCSIPTGGFEKRLLDSVRQP